MPPTWLITNQSAGKGRHAEELQNFLRNHPHVKVHFAQTTMELQPLVKRAQQEGVDLIGIAGGDGSVHHFFNALLKLNFNPTTFILPCGSANDFARSIGLTDWKAAIEAFEHCSHRSFDVMKTSGDRCIVNALTGGVSAMINERMTDDVKSFWGRFAYARVAAELIGEAPNFVTRVTVDGRQLKAPASAVVVANGRGAGGLELVPAADPTDGLLDVVVVSATDLNERLQALAMFATGKHLESEHVEHVRGRTIKLESIPPMPLMADGDEFGNTPIEVSIVKRALKICAMPA